MSGRPSARVVSSDGRDPGRIEERSTQPERHVAGRLGVCPASAKESRRTGAGPLRVPFLSRADVPLTLDTMMEVGPGGRRPASWRRSGQTMLYSCCT